MNAEEDIKCLGPVILVTYRQCCKKDIRRGRSNEDLSQERLRSSDHSERQADQVEPNLG